MTQERQPINIMTLKEVVDRYLEMRPGRELRVCIPNNKGGIGGTSVTDVVYAGGGIDWDAGKFLIYPQVKMIEMPVDFTDSDYKIALDKIKSMKGLIERLISASESNNDVEMGHAIRFAKSMLDVYKNSPHKKKSNTPDK